MSAIYIYIYICIQHICCRVKKLSKICLFCVKNLSQFSFFGLFVFFQKDSSFCRENEIFSEKKTKTKITIFESNICPIMLRNMLGQIFDSTLARFLTQPFFHIFDPFFLSQNMLKPLIFIGLSAKIAFL